MNPSRCAALLALALAALPQPASACGGSLSGPLYLNRHNPDLPLSRMRDGHVGVLPEAGAWHRADRVAAWRALTNVALSADEHAAWVRYTRATHLATPPALVDAAVPVAPASDDLGGYDPDPAPWYEARAAATGSRGPNIVNERAGRGAWTPNCLSDAFTFAAGVLQARRSQYGSEALVRAWIDAQDLVFGNCGPNPGRTPQALAPTALELARRDRAWQIAASHFYAARYDEAERAFRAIAADDGSPFAQLARYLVVRTLARAARRAGVAPDAEVLTRAEQEADAILADAHADAVHAMTRRYRDWVRAQRDPAERARELGVALSRVDADFEAHLQDYVRLLDTTAPDPFARVANDSDRLTAWLGAIEGHRASADSTPRSVALDNLRRTHASVWAVAALVAPGDARDPALAPALAAALAVQRDDPAYASARYHRLRILAARGERVYDDALALAASLDEDDGPTARNLTRELAAANAPDIERFVLAAHGLPAGVELGEGLTVPPSSEEPSSATEVFSPLGAATLTTRVPLGVLLRAARVTTLPASLRDALIAAVLLRSVWLDDEPTRVAAATLLPRATRALQDSLRALAQAGTRDARHLELLRLLQRGVASMAVTTPVLDVPADAAGMMAARCERAVPTLPVAPFLSTAERAALVRERQRMATLGDLTTWSATEAARLATVSSRDPAMPAMLAAAVRATRNNGCGAQAPVHAASRAAFSALHRLYPRSREAAETRYWY